VITNEISFILPLLEFLRRMAEKMKSFILLGGGGYYEVCLFFFA
jgi:hypothetical protein